MPNEDVTAEDLKATAEAKVDDVKESVKGRFDDVKDSVRNVDLSINQKLIITGVAAIVVSAVVQRVVTRFRAIHVDEVLVVVPQEPTLSK